MFESAKEMLDKDKKKEEREQRAQESNKIDGYVLTDGQTEKYLLAEKLGLKIQMEIILMKSLGYKCLPRIEMRNVLGIDDDNFYWSSIKSYENNIPKKVMEIIQYLEKSHIFEDLKIIYSNGSNTEVLIGTKKTGDKIIYFYITEW